MSDQASDETVERDKEQLEALGQKIEEARQHADEALESPFHEESRLYADSGDTPEEDDQTITPPG